MFDYLSLTPPLVSGKADKKMWVLPPLALVGDLRHASPLLHEGLLTPTQSPNHSLLLVLSHATSGLRGQPDLCTQPRFVSNNLFHILLVCMYGVINFNIQTKFWVGIYPASSGLKQFTCSN